MSKEVICKMCGELKLHYAKGKCKKCYQEQYYIDNNVELLKQKKKYQKNHPTFSFLGRNIPFKNHNRAPKGYVWHHTLYDYNDPEANMMLMSRGEHTIMHSFMRLIDLEIPRINFPIDTKMKDS